MVDSLAIGGYDPYFLQAYNSPNYYQMQQAQTPSAPTTSNISFKGNDSTGNTDTTQQNAKKKNNATAWTIIGTVATVGAAALCHKAGAVKGTKGFWKKIGDGAKDISQNAFKKDFWKKIFKATPETSDVKRFSAVINDDDTISYIIPGVNITKKGKHVAAYTKKHAINTTGLGISKTTDDVFNMFKEFDLKVGKHTVTYKDGNVVKIVKEGIDNPVTDKKAIEEYLKKNPSVSNSLESNLSKMQENNFDRVNISNIKYQIQRGDETFVVKQADFKKPDEYEILELTTLKRLDKNSVEVKDYFFKNPEERKYFEELTSTKIPESLRTIQRPVKIDDVIYQIKDDTIVSFEKNGKIYIADTPEFNAEMGKIENLTEITKKCIENKTYLPGTIISV